VLLQSAFKARVGRALTPGDIKQLLRETGSPQQSSPSGALESIGPLPNVSAAIAKSLSTNRSFMIHNHGIYGLNVTQIVLQPQVSGVSWEPLPPFVVPPNSSRSISVSLDYGRLPDGIHSIRLEVASNDFTPFPQNKLDLLLNPVPQPFLEIRRVNQRVVCSWSTNYTNFILENSLAPTNGANWVRIQVNPVVIDGRYVITNTIFSHRFFRLRMLLIGAAT
jgi:hypothetical protein